MLQIPVFPLLYIFIFKSPLVYEDEAWNNNDPSPQLDLLNEIIFGRVPFILLEDNVKIAFKRIRQERPGHVAKVPCLWLRKIYTSKISHNRSPPLL